MTVGEVVLLIDGVDGTYAVAGESKGNGGAGDCESGATLEPRRPTRIAIVSNLRVSSAQVGVD